MRTCAEALAEHGFTGAQLLKLSRKAAVDALRRHGAHLDHDRFEELADYMLEVGVRYAPRYEHGYGIAIQTYLYRTMRVRYIDWCRSTLGDSRYPGRRPRKLPSGGFVPLLEADGPVWDDLEQEAAREAAERLADELDLSEDGRWTLIELVARQADGEGLTAAAREAGVGRIGATQRLDGLRGELVARGYGDERVSA